jgi:hypothetical protein
MLGQGGEKSVPLLVAGWRRLAFEEPEFAGQPAPSGTPPGTPRRTST